MRTITPEEALKMAKKGSLLVDVRTPAEYRAVHAEGALCFPLDKLQKNIKEIVPVINKHKDILLICKSGARTKIACDILEKQFDQTFLIVEGAILYLDRFSFLNIPLPSVFNNISVTILEDLFSPSKVIRSSSFLSYRIFVNAWLMIFSGIWS